MMPYMAEATLTGVPPGHGVISKLTSDDGDFRFTWDPSDPQDVQNARDAFNDLRRGGYAAYNIEGEGRGRAGRRTVITEFDPQAGQIVVVRPNRGG
jgi:hypothetical protein